MNPHRLPELISLLAAAMLLAALSRTTARAQPPANPLPSPAGIPQTPAPATAETRAAQPALEDIGGGRYRVGAVQIDKNQSSASFPAKINQVEGSLEYLLVTPGGSTHESLLVTDVSPKQLHVAMLLLGAQTSKSKSEPAPGQINADFLRNAPAPEGHPVQITATWQDKERTLSTPVEDWILHTGLQRSAERGPWIYTGSYIREGSFLAELDGCFAALVHNPSALINNPRQGRDDDSAWEPHRQQIPAAGTPVEITIHLLSTAAKNHPAPAKNTEKKNR